MDLSLDSETLFTLSEHLLDLKVPFLFIVTGDDRSDAVHPFRLSQNDEDRQAILHALAREAEEYAPVSGIEPQFGASATLRARTLTGSLGRG